jgi:hypothetical protein
MNQGNRVNKGGLVLIRRHTVRERLREKLRQVKETIWRMMHRPIAEQGLYLKRVMNGFLNYFAVRSSARGTPRHFAIVGVSSSRPTGTVICLTRADPGY